MGAGFGGRRAPPATARNALGRRQMGWFGGIAGRLGRRPAARRRESAEARLGRHRQWRRRDHVWVTERVPLALSEAELAVVLDAIAETGNDRLQVGFNRRFAPLLRQAKAEFGTRVGPASVRYLVNAGKLEHGSWYNQADSEGTRFAGEGGHFVDTVSWLLDGDPVSVFATATPGQDDLQILLRYPDGSTAALTYATSGAPGFPKETLDLLADRKVLRLDDFVKASVHAKKRWQSSRLPRGRDKGQRAELDAFLTAVASGGPLPVPVDSLVATTLATLAVRTSLNTGAPVRLELPAHATAADLVPASSRNGAPA